MLSNRFPPDVEGGAEILAADIAERLERLGHHVDVLTSASAASGTPSQPGIQRTLRLANPVRFDHDGSIWRQARLPYDYYRRYHQPDNAAQLLRAIDDLRPDVLYIWEVSGLGVTTVLGTLPRVSVPIVFHLGSYWLLYAHAPETVHSRLHAPWLKRLLIGPLPALASASMIAVSGAVKGEYVRAGFDPERIEVIHNGVSARFLQHPSAHNTEPDMESNHTPTRLLFVGRLCPEKGVLSALQALDLLATKPASAHGDCDSRFRLDIVGDGQAAYVRDLRAFVREKHLTDLVVFRGKVPQEDLIGCYDRADILLNPSLWQEPFGLISVEAMARGLPVIASRVGGTQEIVTHGVNGLLYEPGDTYALAAAIQQLASDGTLRARFGAASRRTIQEHFTLEENARRVAQHLQRAIQSSVALTVDVAAGSIAPEGVRRTIG
jgi:glycosyltransferase involved in cell wall biosynthesis